MAIACVVDWNRKRTKVETMKLTPENRKFDNTNFNRFFGFRIVLDEYIWVWSNKERHFLKE